jgi:hypothetical protein
VTGDTTEKSYTPPRTGPSTKPIPKQAAARPTNSIFFLKSEIVTRIVMPLLATPAAPTPATARPAILQHLVLVSDSIQCMKTL